MEEEKYYPTFCCGWTHDLHTSCNESDMDITMQYGVASILKYLGFGQSVIQRLVKTSIKKNLYYEIKEKVIEEAFNGYRVNKNKALVRVFGLDSTRDVRARLIEILYDRVSYHKDKFVAKILHDEMEAMETKRTGKVEHSDTTHDDQVFSYLMALYVWYDGKNITQNFNIQKNVIKTDEDEEVISGGIEENETTERVDIDEVQEDINDELQDQLEFIKDAAKVKLGIMYNNEVYTQEDQQLNYLLSTNKAARNSYCSKYNLDQDNGMSTSVTVMIPDSVFLDDEDLEAESNNFNGNMFDMFNNL